jgi:hypothetical protein
MYRKVGAYGRREIGAGATIACKFTPSMYFFKKLHSGAPEANPTIVSYNASAVKIYNATSSQVRFENKSLFYKLEKRASLLQR